jgi:biofilm PGA synthesis N-glycosyltransferase PgaC
MTPRIRGWGAGFWWQLLTICAFAITLVVLFALLHPTTVYLSLAIIVLPLLYPAVTPLLKRLPNSPNSRMIVALVFSAGVVGVLAYGGWLVWRGVLPLQEYLFIPALGLVVYSIWPVICFSFYHAHWDEPPTTPRAPLPSLSVLIPAYNEEGYVGDAIEALLNAEYPTENLEIIVIDDGSTDHTYEEATTYTNQHPVRVFHKDNGGKFSALNYGLYFATGDLIAAIDADCSVEANALQQIVAPLQHDPDVGAVAGDVHVANQTNLLTYTQSLEYLVSINLHRRMYDALRIVPVIPGCLGVFRRSALEAVGGYDPDTLTEDFDLTLQLLKHGYDIRISPAVTYTETPPTWYDLYQQRLRWYRGNFETLLKHADVISNPQYGYLHSVALPLRLVSMASGPLITILVLASIFWSVSVGHTAGILPVFLLFAILEVLSAILALQLFQKPLKFAALALFRGTIYKLVNDAITLQALVSVLARSESTWTHSRRINQHTALRDHEQNK